MLLEPNEVSLFGRIVDSSKSHMSKAAANGILALEFSSDDQMPLKELAAKARDGTLTRREKK